MISNETVPYVQFPPSANQTSTVWSIRSDHVEIHQTVTNLDFLRKKTCRAYLTSDLSSSMGTWNLFALQSKKMHKFGQKYFFLWIWSFLNCFRFQCHDCWPSKWWHFLSKKRMIMSKMYDLLWWKPNRKQNKN